MKSCKDYSIFTTPSSSTSQIEVVGVSPIVVQKNQIGDTTRYTIKNTQLVPDKGVDGEDGKSATIKVGTVTSGKVASITNSGTTLDAIFDFTLPKGDKGDPGDSIKGDIGEAATIEIGSVVLDDITAVTNSGTNTHAILDFKLQRGAKGKDGDPGVALGLQEYKFTVGNNGGSYQNMGTFTQGTYLDLGDNPFGQIRKLRIRAWVTVANMQNWTALKLSSGDSPTFNGSNLLTQRIKHSEGEGYVGQYEISVYKETKDQYVGFSFADNVGGNYSSDGSQYGDYGLEIFILP